MINDTDQVTKEKTPMMNIRPASSRRGFTLIELAIVLAIAGVLFVGLWRLLAGGNQQIKDTTAATQQGQLITAVKAFLATPDGQQFMTYDAAGGQRASNAQFNLPLPKLANAAGSVSCKTDPDLKAGMDNAGTTTKTETWCNSLPPGFNADSVNAYMQTYAIGIRRDGTAAGEKPHTYSFMIVTVGGDTIPDSSGGRISAQIGADGGFVYTNQVCAPTPANACGAFGAWTALLNNYSLSTLGGHIASRTFSSPEDSSAMPWLARPLLPGDDTNRYFNTMTTDLFMGRTGTSAPTNINMKSYTAATDLGGNINMYGGDIDLGVGNDATSLPQTGQIKLANTTPSRALVSFLFSTPPAGPNIIEVTTGCTGQKDAQNLGIPYLNNCSPGVSVIGDVSATLLNVTQAFAQVFFYQSDKRLKNDIKPIKGALDTLMNIEPVHFKFNGSDKESMGVIAQDIEKIYPDIVTVNSKNGMKSVAYHELIAPMIEAIQELKRDNDNLRRELKEQHMRQEQIEKRLSGQAAQ